MASTDAKLASGAVEHVAGQPVNFQDNVRRFVKRSWFASILALLQVRDPPSYALNAHVDSASDIGLARDCSQLLY
jgi:hypothetical protein